MSEKEAIDTMLGLTPQEALGAALQRMVRSILQAEAEGRRITISVVKQEKLAGVSETDYTEWTFRTTTRERRMDDPRKES